MASEHLTFVFYEPELRALLDGPEGPVARDLLRRGTQVANRARYYATGNDGGPSVRTGRLRSSITQEMGRDSHSLYCDVGTNVFYGLVLELGLGRMTRPYRFLQPALRDAAD